MSWLGNIWKAYYFASSFLRMRRSSINASALVVQSTLPKRIMMILSIGLVPSRALSGSRNPMGIMLLRKSCQRITFT
jgi:hypothetical protein